MSPTEGVAAERAGGVFPAGDPVAVAREVAIAGERVRVVETGEAGSTPVVLLHGWGASAYNYRAVLPLLAPAGFRAIAPDLRGHGWSDKPSFAGAYSTSATVAWVSALLDEFRIDRCVLVGQSIGGAMALDAAAAMPDRIGAVVLLSSIGFTRVRRVALARALGVRRWHPSTTPRWIVTLVLQRIYGTRRPWTQRDADEYWFPLRSADTVAALMQSLEEFDFEPRNAAAVGHLGPRLVIRFGELDRLIPWRAAMRHASGFPGADAAVIRGAGHVPAEEAPDEVAAAIVEAAALMRRAGR